MPQRVLGRRWSHLQFKVALIYSSAVVGRTGSPLLFINLINDRTGSAGAGIQRALEMYTGRRNLGTEAVRDWNFGRLNLLYLTMNVSCRWP